MAVMWPRKLPEWVVQDPRRAAEREVYRKLDLVLDDGWSVYYSRPWWGITRTGAEVDGEADFVVAHPDRGVLFLEVKGGLVNHDPKTMIWTSRDRDGITHRIKDPVQQAMKAKHELLKKLRRGNGWPSHRVRLRHGVVLPDCEPLGAGTIAGYEPELFCFAADLRDRFASWLKQRLSSHVDDPHQTEAGPGGSGIAAIDGTIAAPARLAVPLHRQLSSDIAEQDALLTGAQLMAITSIEAIPRTVVEGGAGTGKTLIACELAVRYARAGRMTLLCCLSSALAASLKRRIGAELGLEVMTLSEVANAMSLGELTQLSAVIVDEGQDVDWQQWDMVERLVAKEGLLCVLFDSNQAVYRARDDLETRLQATCFPLRLNLRNTKHVAAVTEKLYRGPLIACAGSDGQSPVLLETTAANAPDAVLQVVQSFVSEQRIPAADIVVLAGDGKAAAQISSKLLTARLKTTDAFVRAPDSVVVETIARFKGLEAAAVVVMADRLAASNTELSYVAVSRARALLVVIGPVSDTLLGKAVKGAMVPGQLDGAQRVPLG